MLKQSLEVKTKKVIKNRVGRPSKYSQELADRICAELGQGNSLRTVTAADDVPSFQTVFSWLRLYPEFLDQYTRAKEEASDAFIEEMQYIADNVVPEKGPVSKAHLQVETRKWIASKLKPKKYGTQIDVTSGGDKIVPIIQVGANYTKRDVIEAEEIIPERELDIPPTSSNTILDIN